MTVASAPARPAIDEPRKLIGVVPPSAAHARVRLLDALEQAFPVRFEGRPATGLTGLDGVLVIAGSDPGFLAKELARLPACPRLVALADDQSRSPLQLHTVALAASRVVTRALRGRALREECRAAAVSVAVRAGDELLALADGRPVWWRHRDRGSWTDLSAFCPQELGELESLRDHLRAGRFMGLVPLLHLLAHVCAEQWEPPPLHASFVIDDPNLHWPSYGYLDYAELAAHASRHGYHLGLAMVPLDGWRASPRAASLIRENPSALSVLMHGNDHRSGELVRLAGTARAEAVIAQALRRTAAFERRAGVPVQRVMVPPHEVCSQRALAAMFRLGLDAACIGRRYPWHGRPERRSDARAPAEPGAAEAWPLAKWHPTDTVGGLPIIPRHAIDQPWEDLAFRALLGQPLVLFGHSADLANGLDVLAAAADYTNGLGRVQWGPLGWIARQCFRSRRDGEALIVQLHSRRVTVEIPDGVTVLVAQTPSLCGHEPIRYLAAGARRVPMAREARGWTSAALPVAPGMRLELTLTPERAVDPALVSTPRPTPWPLMRRALAEGRDRIQPLSKSLSPSARC